MIVGPCSREAHEKIGWLAGKCPLFWWETHPDKLMFKQHLNLLYVYVSLIKKYLEKNGQEKEKVFLAGWWR